MKIVIDKDIPFIKGVLEPFAEVVYLRGGAISAGDVADADALVVRTRTHCDSTLLEGSKVKAIATATIGYDHIDTQWCRAEGIDVFTSAGCNARAVLQWIGAVLLWMEDKGWMVAPGQTTLGVIGVGNVGSLVADYASMWGFKVLCCDPLRERDRSRDGILYTPAEYFTAGQVARLSDIVTFHVPLSRNGDDPTEGIISQQFIDALKPGAVVINSSRGEITDEPALSRAAEGGRVKCIIDTWAHEPLIDRCLADLALLATPHIAGYSMQGKAMGTAMAVRSLSSRFGWPLGDWYPDDAGLPSQPRGISWAEMRRMMPARFDIEALSARLKMHPENFEAMRSGYEFRQEFF